LLNRAVSFGQFVARTSTATPFYTPYLDVKIIDMYFKLLLLFIIWVSPALASEYRVVTDPDRQRDIPIHVSFPLDASVCNVENRCPVAVLSSGYGVAFDKYSFISVILNKAGYLVVAIQHELPGDPALAVAGNLYTERSENWKRGAETVKFVRSKLQSEFSDFDFNRLTLVGHSNGGDISSWLINEGVDFVETLITLDHRRVPLPRGEVPNVFSIRGSDYPADEAVLYTDREKTMLNACIVQIANSKHNEMTDFGPDWLKTSITNALLGFLSGKCNSSYKA